MKLRSRRLLAGLAATGTVAGSAALLTTLPAAAAGAPRLAVDTTTIRAAAGTCSVVVVTPQDVFGVTSTTSGDPVTVLLSESPTSGTQDLDFCTTGADTPTTDPSYSNGAQFDLANQGTSEPAYKAGPGITDSGTSSGGDPDVADNATQPTPNADGDGGKYFTTNPDGIDRARYTFRPGSAGIRVGVVGLTSGSGTVKAFYDNGDDTNADNYELDDDEVQAPTVTFTVTPGGKPQTVEAYNAVTSVVAQPTEDAAPPGEAQEFTAALRNSSGDPVRGVTPRIAVGSSGSNPGAPAACAESDNNGVSACSFTGTEPGTDTLTVYVNRAGGSAGLDSGEASDTLTRTTTLPTVAASAARYLDLNPATASTVAGAPATFTATVSDVNGAPAEGVTVTFAETGPGRFSGGSETATRTTDSAGRARVVVTSTSGESGNATVGAVITSTGTQCSQRAGAGTGATSTTPAGRCSDSSNLTITVPASPTPSSSTAASPSATASASPSRSATATATTSPSASASATGTPSSACRTVNVTVTTRTINATGLASVTAVGAAPGSTVQLQGYSQNHYGTENFGNDETPVDRTGTADNNGSVTFSDLRPASNTRLRARVAGCTYTGNTDVIEVRAQETLTVKRTGIRSYTFSGRSIPAREGGLIVSLYRVTGQACGAGVEPSRCPGETFLGQGRAVALGQPGEGLYSINVRFPARDQNVRDEFVVKTGRDAQNAPGRSNVRSLAIF